MNAPAKGSPVEIVLADSAGGEDVLRGVLLGRFDGDHVEVKFDDLPFKAIVERRLVRRFEASADDVSRGGKAFADDVSSDGRNGETP
jgi:hypothetical protein